MTTNINFSGDLLQKVANKDFANDNMQSNTTIQPKIEQIQQDKPDEFVSTKTSAAPKDNSMLYKVLGGLAVIGTVIGGIFYLKKGKTPKKNINTEAEQTIRLLGGQNNSNNSRKISATAEELLERFSSKNYDEVLKEFNDVPELKNALTNVSVKTKISREEVVEKFNKGDYETISSVLQETSKSLYPFLRTGTKNTDRNWDIMIDYAGKLNTIIKDEAQLETINNFRALAIAQKIRFNKNNKELSEAYHELLQKELKTILYKNEQPKSEQIIKDLADNLSYNSKANSLFTDEHKEIIYNALKELKESKKNLYSKDDLAELDALFYDVRERLNIRTFEDVYEEMKQRFYQDIHEANSSKGSASGKGSSSNSRAYTSFATKEEAIATINRYSDTKIDANVTPDELKKIYRKIVIKYHPDRAPQDKLKEYTEICQKITEAYENLKA